MTSATYIVVLLLVSMIILVSGQEQSFRCAHTFMNSFVQFLMPESSQNWKLKLKRCLIKFSRRLGGRNGPVAPALGIKCTTAEIRAINEAREKLIFMVSSFFCSFLSATGLEKWLQLKFFGQVHRQLHDNGIIQRLYHGVDGRFGRPCNWLICRTLLSVHCTVNIVMVMNIHFQAQFPSQKIYSETPIFFLGYLAIWLFGCML